MYPYKKAAPFWGGFGFELYASRFIIRRLVFGDPVAGWASTVVIILFIGGIQLLSIGILGLYLSKLYLEAKDRPIYLIGESNIEKPTEKN